jgi:hypothetical protein
LLTASAGMLKISAIEQSAAPMSILFFIVSSVL